MVGVGRAVWLCLIVVFELAGWLAGWLACLPPHLIWVSIYLGIDLSWISRWSKRGETGRQTDVKEIDRGTGRGGGERVRI